MQFLPNKGRRNVPKVNPKGRKWIKILFCVNAIGQRIRRHNLLEGSKALKKNIKDCEPRACWVLNFKAWMMEGKLAVPFAEYVRIGIWCFFY